MERSIMDKFTITPNKISHNEKPEFQANWLSGEAEASPYSTNISDFCYDGSGGDDRLLISGIKWQTNTPAQKQFNGLMNKAISAIDNWISERF